MRPGLVSVIMPAYNGGTFIQQAINSVIAQTYPDWELIIVDDGSTDDTATIVATYHEPRIQYVYQTNRGQAAALNHGLVLADGEYVTTLDVDDWFTEDSLAHRVQHLNLHPTHGAVYGDGFCCDVAGRPLMRFSDYRTGDVAGDIYATLICMPLYGTGANVLVRRAVLAQHDIRYDESIVWCQDYDIYIRLAAVTPFGFVAIPTVWYRIHSANMTTTMDEQRRLDSLVATRLKILNSARFAALSVDEKVSFFNSVLNQDFSGRETVQTLLINSMPFRTLPRTKQAKLLRVAAYVYLVEETHTAFARQLLRWAWAHNPLEPRSLVALLMGYANSKVAANAIQNWRRLRSGHAKSIASPFEISKTT